MSVLDYTKQLYLFTPYEVNVIKILIQQYINKNSKIFTYLNEIDLNQVQFFWYKDSNENVLGGFHILSYDPKVCKYAIYINMFFEYENKGDQFDVISLALGTILHQLKHYHQLKTLGYFWYGLLQLPIIRNYTIEPAAYKISDYINVLKLQNRITLKQKIYLKIKYNVSDNYLSKRQLKIINEIKNKNIDIQKFRHHQDLFTYKLIELWLQNK